MTHAICKRSTLESLIADPFHAHTSAANLQAIHQTEECRKTNIHLYVHRSMQWINPSALNYAPQKTLLRFLKARTEVT